MWCTQAQIPALCRQALKSALPFTFRSFALLLRATRPAQRKPDPKQSQTEVWSLFKSLLT